MDPWTIIGWLLVSLIGLALFTVLLPVVVAIVVVSVRFASKRAAWLKTRCIQPKAGQVWEQDGSRDQLHIQRIDDETGNIFIRLNYARSHVGWVDTPEDWRKRVRTRHCRLVKDVA